MIILDRDGVLNSLVVDSEHGTIDSPLHPRQVVVFDWVASALSALFAGGYGLVIASNQPAWAKGKTTRENLEEVHQEVLRAAESGGGKILSSHCCFHKSEDRCGCRKPKTGLLEEAFRQNPLFDPAKSWMVGDGVTDVQAGKALSLKTAFLGPRKCDACKIFEDQGLRPDFWGKNILEFADFLLRMDKRI